MLYIDICYKRTRGLGARAGPSFPIALKLGWRTAMLLPSATQRAKL